MLKLMTSD